MLVKWVGGLLLSLRSSLCLTLSQFLVQVAALDTEGDLVDLSGVVCDLVVHVEVKLEHLCLTKLHHVNGNEERDGDEISEDEDVGKESQHGSLSRVGQLAVWSFAFPCRVIAGTPKVAAVLDPRTLKVLGGDASRHSAKDDVHDEHEDSEVITHLHNAGDLGGGLSTVHLNLGLLSSVDDNTPRPLGLPEDDSAQQNVLRSKRDLLPVRARVGAFEVQEAVVGEFTHYLCDERSESRTGF